MIPHLMKPCNPRVPSRISERLECTPLCQILERPSSVFRQVTGHGSSPGSIKPKTGRGAAPVVLHAGCQIRLGRRIPQEEQGMSSRRVIGAILAVLESRFPGLLNRRGQPAMLTSPPRVAWQPGQNRVGYLCCLACSGFVGI